MAKTLRVQEVQEFVDEMSSTDIQCEERKEENHDSWLIIGDDTRESSVDLRNNRKEDYYSTLPKVCHDILYLTLLTLPLIIVIAITIYKTRSDRSLGECSLRSKRFCAV